MNPVHINKTLMAIVTSDRQVNTDKVRLNGQVVDTSQSVNTKVVEQNPHQRLQTLLTNLPALQRFVALLSSLNTTSTTPQNFTQQILSQLLLPNNQATLIPWLRQGAGQSAVQMLLQQLAIPNSTVYQWLSDLSPSDQNDFKALLRLAAEQRVALNAQQDSDIPTVLQLHLAQAQGKEIKLHVWRDKAKSGSQKNEKQESWHIDLTLPIGGSETLITKAVWKNQQLHLLFSSTSAQLLQRTELLAPHLTHRMQSLGIATSNMSFKQESKTFDSEHNTTYTGLIAKI
ncbi:hypothetical protein ASV53_01950 [Photobacterium sanguinicancri]|uniref:Flagellar hook-length control protein-like C-terminal domain-containing protein n=2 Tax=Photobacterium sanguinicancri TaxID=875932 RepID=A0ABX4G3T1_9GAMM|nr:hypothetical protein ASV53_01950 [Photobacterium sanguinicancri]